MQLFDQPQAGLLALCAVIFPSTVLLKAPHSWKCVNYRAFTTWFASPKRYWALLCLWYSKWATPKKQAKSGFESCSAEVDPQYPGTAVERLQGIHLRVKTLSKEELSGDWQAGWNVPMPCSLALSQTISLEVGKNASICCGILFDYYYLAKTSSKKAPLYLDCKGDQLKTSKKEFVLAIPLHLMRLSCCILMILEICGRMCGQSPSLSTLML